MAAVKIQLGRKLGKKRYALIDEEDLPQLSKFVWHAVAAGSAFYAKTNDGRLGSNIRWMHRMIMGVGSDQLIDHINGNGLDNRRCNLRVAKPVENSRNSFKTTAPWPTSKYKGVSWRGRKWGAGITVNGDPIDLGLFVEEEDAARAYDAMALEKFGDFARTNEMMGLYPDQTPVNRHAFEVQGRVIPNADDLLTPEEKKAKHVAMFRRQAKTARVINQRIRSHVPLMTWSQDEAPVLIRNGEVIGPAA
jgi:hypothetical protein